MCQAILDLIEDGKEEGKLKGKLEGRLEGKMEGSESKEKEIVLNMHNNKISPKEIAQLTGIPLERVKEIIQP